MRALQLLPDGCGTAASGSRPPAGDRDAGRPRASSTRSWRCTPMRSAHRGSVHVSCAASRARRRAARSSPASRCSARSPHAASPTCCAGAKPRDPKIRLTIRAGVNADGVSPRGIRPSRYTILHVAIAATGIAVAFATGRFALVLVITVIAGVLAHFAGFVHVRRRDLTARKEAEARYRTLVEQLPLITYVDSPYSSDEAAAFVIPADRVDPRLHTGRVAQQSRLLRRASPPGRPRPRAELAAHRPRDG